MQPLPSTTTRLARVSGHNMIAAITYTNRTPAKRIGENNKANRPNETVVAFCLSISPSQKRDQSRPRKITFIGFNYLVRLTKRPNVIGIRLN